MACLEASRLIAIRFSSASSGNRCSLLVVPNSEWVLRIILKRMGRPRLRIGSLSNIYERSCIAGQAHGAIFWCGQSGCIIRPHIQPQGWRRSRSLLAANHQVFHSTWRARLRWRQWMSCSVRGRPCLPYFDESFRKLRLAWRKSRMDIVEIMSSKWMNGSWSSWGRINKPRCLEQVNPSFQGIFMDPLESSWGWAQLHTSLKLETEGCQCCRAVIVANDKSHVRTSLSWQERHSSDPISVSTCWTHSGS